MAVLVDRVVGHDHQKDILSLALQKKSLPHAMIFSGPEGIGKTQLAKALAQSLVCEQNKLNPQLQACGYCGSCLRASHGQSESIKIISPMQSSQIKIDQIRDVLDFLSLSHEGQNRVIIIDQAQALNPQAANSLLKTLEEPFDRVFFILITLDVRLLMPTIRSRSQVIPFHLMSTDQLKTIEPGCPHWVYKAARGSVSRLKELSQDDLVVNRQEHLRFFESFWTDHNFLLSGMIKEFVKDRANALKIVQDWLQFTRDLLYVKAGQVDYVINSDFKPDYKKFDSITSERLQKFVTQLLRSEKETDKLDLTLFFESLWVQYARD